MSNPKWYHLPTTWGAVSAGFVVLALVVGLVLRSLWWIAPAVLAVAAAVVAAYLGWRIMQEQIAFGKQAESWLSVADDVKSVIGSLS